VIDILTNMDIYIAVIPLRITLGVIMLDSGIGKWRRGISGTGHWFASLGFPKPQILARFVATLETVCGLLIIIGLFTPIAALLVAANMTVATYVQKFKLRASFQGGESQGYELDILLVVSALTVAAVGGQAFAIETIIFNN
jgi:uncharacterized membrane protein YphA (DoxX/SURF4 family)